jgi:hypothetical protein
VRRARVRTAHADPEVVAAAVEPDNTDSMTTRVDGAAVETTIARETTGGLHSSVDDYVVNLAVADRLARDERGRTEADDAADGDDGADSDTSDTSDTSDDTDTGTDRRTDATEPTDDQTDTTHDTDTHE